MAVDPVDVLEGGLEHFSRYGYAYNNPYRYIDPTGLIAEKPSFDSRSSTDNKDDLSFDGPIGGRGGSSHASHQETTVSLGWGIDDRGSTHVAGAPIGVLAALLRAYIKKKLKEEAKQAAGVRRKNRIPDEGDPNSVVSNPAGTTVKKYGPDGRVQKEWNKGHTGKNTPSNERTDHIHDHKPNPRNPTGKTIRMPGRKPRPQDLHGLGLM